MKYKLVNIRKIGPEHKFSELEQGALLTLYEGYQKDLKAQEERMKLAKEQVEELKNQGESWARESIERDSAYQAANEIRQKIHAFDLCMVILGVEVIEEERQEDS